MDFCLFQIMFYQFVGILILRPRSRPESAIGNTEMSADGSVIIGTKALGGNGEEPEVFIWNEFAGKRNLEDVLANDFGLNLSAWDLDVAQAASISADATIIAGRGNNPSGESEAWKAVLSRASVKEEVQIDVKPASDPNSINLCQEGVLPIATFTADAFNAANVDVTTVQFAGAAAVHSALEDVDGDGDLDLILHFNVQDTTLAATYRDLLREDLEDGKLNSRRKQVNDIALTGETFDGAQFQGFDTLDLFFSGKSLREILKTL